MKLFDLDGPIYRIGTEIADFMILALYWFIACMPIITVGASTSSLFYVFGKKIRGEDTYVTKDFVKSFKQNFKQSIPLSLFLGILWMSVSAYYFVLIGHQGQAPFYLLVVAMLFMIEVVLFTVYSLGILSRFYMKFSQIIVTSFILAHKHLLTSILIIGGVFVINYVSMTVPVLIIFSPALYILFCTFFLQKIFAIHIAAAEELKKDQEHSEEIQDIADNIMTQTTTLDPQNQTLENMAEETVKNIKMINNEEDENRDFLKYI